MSAFEKAKNTFVLIRDRICIKNVFTLKNHFHFLI